ncbi:MAG: O-antigen ligase family protein [Deltaproteobacteria bacterium]|nr:O-antigen ligase family protein [Deltaproteobacteria bacterium]
MSGKYILVISIIISFIMLIMTYSRTSLYAAMFTILVVCILKFANKNVIKVIVASGMTVVVFLVAIHNFDMERINSPELKRLIAPLQNPLNASSFRSRLPIWLSALDAAKQSPWLGSGPKSFRKKHNREFVKEHYVELTSRFGKNVIDLDTVRMPNAHNQFLQMLIDYGVIGLIFFLGALLYPLLIAVRRRCCFGLLAPLLIHYCLYSLADNTLDGYIAYFPAFVVFSSLGYFACLRAGPESVVSGPARAPLAARPASGSL